MLPDNHTFFSDPHITNTVQWIEGCDDPMLIREAHLLQTKTRKHEQIRLVFGAFVFMLIVISASQLSFMDSAKKRASVASAVEENTFQSPAPRSDVPFPTLSAESFAVRFIGSYAELERQREWKELPPASLTKILTAMVALETLPPSAEIKLSKTAKAAGEKMSRTPTGESFTRDDAVKFMLIESDNDLAAALAEAVERQRTGNNPEEGLPHFVKIMNEGATRAGMKHSHFENPTGLDQDGHFVTAEDLQNLVEYIWNKYPQIWEYTTLTTAKIISQQSRLYEAKNTDTLLNDLPALKGGKTGLTEKAKGTLILLYPVKPSYIAVIVILGSDNRFEDGKKIIQWLEDAF